jgi:hypothetical protein
MQANNNPLFLNSGVITHALRGGLFIILVILCTLSAVSILLANIKAADAQSEHDISQKQPSSSAEIADMM